MADVALLEVDHTVEGLVKDSLRSAGHTVHSSGDLSDLMVRVASRVDLLIADAATGVPPQRVVSAARAMDPDLPILLTTTFIEPLEERLLLQLGADAVLRKPFDLPTFLDLVDILSTSMTRRPTPT